MLSFVHLSDIHFHQHSGDDYDRETDLRAELLSDIRTNFSTSITSVDGILLCGDIAFSGKLKEYKVAHHFITEIREALSVNDLPVYCVPGNHDVDQEILQKKPAVKVLRDTLETQQDSNTINSCLRGFLGEKSSATLLYATIACYNSNFAGKYSCNLPTKKLIWEKKLGLKGKYTLCLVGLNSTIISSIDDHKKNRLMIISETQIPTRKNGFIYLTLCHHPPEYWNDPEQQLASKMNQRVHLQLYGHKHSQKIEQKGDSLIIASGATHPSRREPEWLPRYNWITVDVDTKGRNEYLVVKIYPRVYSKAKYKFEKDEKLCTEKEDFFKHEINLSQESSNVTTSSMNIDETIPPFEINKDTAWENMLTFDFMLLTHIDREKILVDLKLIYPKEKEIEHIDLLDKILLRATKQDTLTKLRSKIENAKKRSYYSE